MSHNETDLCRPSYNLLLCNFIDYLYSSSISTDPSLPINWRSGKASRESEDVWPKVAEKLLTVRVLFFLGDDCSGSMKIILPDMPTLPEMDPTKSDHEPNFNGNLKEYGKLKYSLSQMKEH